MKEKNLICNASSGLIAQIITIVVQFATRTFFLKYIGDAILGLDGTLLSILNIISLAEAGFSTSMVVFLVEPLQKKEYGTVNKYINTLRVVYNAIGIIYLAVGLALAPLLKTVIIGIDVTTIIYVYYFVLVINGSLTYFLAYRRVLLSSDQKTYALKNIQSAVLIIFGFLQILSIICTANYLCYLGMKVAQTVFGNVFIYMYCGRKYYFLKRGKYDKEVFTDLKSAVKNLFTGQVAGYIYGSSDALVISAFLSTVQVAYYNNYFLVANGLKTLFASLFVAMVPMLRGNLVSSNGENMHALFIRYTYLCSIITILAAVPAYTIIQTFILAWVGDKYILSIGIFVLMLIDLFICNMQTPMGDFIIASGQFSKSKYPDIVGAIVNIIVSIIFVQYLGLSGVLLGTVISRIIQWGIRFFITYKYCFQTKRIDYIRYVIYIAILAIIIGICCIVSSFLYGLICMNSLFFRMIAGLFIALCVGLIGATVITILNNETKHYVIDLLHKIRRTK